MKYIRDFNNYKKDQQINEELLGGIINFFKNMWTKAVDEIKKLGKNPSPDQVEQWVDKNPMNPADDGYIFKPQMDEFKKKTEANEQDCLDLIQNLLDPQTGCLGTQGLQSLYDGILKTFGKDTPTLDIVKYYMETIRNRAIKDYKFGGGPDLKIGSNPKIDASKLNKDMKDTTHLPEFKKAILAAGQDAKKRKQICVDWVEKTLLPRLDKYASEVTDAQVDEYIKSIGKTPPPDGKDFKVGDTVIYKRDKFKDGDQAEWDKLKDDDKKKPNEGVVKKLMDDKKIEMKKISKIEGDEISFEGADFTKKMDEILMKVDVTEKAEGQEELTKTLGDVKTKNPEAIAKLTNIANLYKDPDANKDKIAEIEKILTPAAK
jgi:hypothetical protein